MAHVLSDPMGEVGALNGPESMEMSVGSTPDVTSRSSASGSPNKKQETKKKPVKVRKEFPETWLWMEEMVK